MPDHRAPYGTTHQGSSRTPRQLRLGLAGTVTALILGAAGCASASHPTPASSVPAASAAGTSATPGGKGGMLPGASYPLVFWATIRDQLARRLHRSVTELTGLWTATAPAGPKGSGGQATTTIVDVATEDGLSTPELRTIEMAAIRQAFAAVVHRGTITRGQADTQLATLTSWDQSNLDGYAMYAFQPH